MRVDIPTQGAARMARIARGDLQFRVPVRPRLCDGLVIVPIGSGLLFEGGPERQLLEGEAAHQLLPRLLPLLDGTRTHDCLAQLVGISEPAVFQAVALLYSCGLLEHGDGAAPATDDIDLFLSRCGDTQRLNRNGREGRTRLEHAVVDIRGDDSVVSHLTALLRQSGISTVRRCYDDPDSDATLIVAVASTPAEGSVLIHLVERARTLDVPVLRVGVYPNSVEIGPLFDRGIETCPACLAACRAEDSPQFSDSDVHVASALAAGEIVHLIARVGQPMALHGISAFRFDPWERTVLVVPPIPGCATCGTPSASASDTATTSSVVLTYERMMAFPPRRFLDAKTHQRHFLQSNVRLQHDRHEFPNSPFSPLPEIDPVAAVGRTTFAEALDRAIARSPGTDGMQALGSLLRLGFGFQTTSAPDGGVNRWVANGANMGSPQCYLGLSRSVVGFESGVYAYDAAAHGLRSLSAKPHQLFAAMHGTPRDCEDEEDGSRIVLVMTGALGRLARKYDSLAYRIILLDAGCVLTQLRLAGSAMGILVAPTTHWDDDAIARALNIDLDREPITAAVRLSLKTRLVTEWTNESPGTVV